LSNIHALNVNVITSNEAEELLTMQYIISIISADLYSFHMARAINCFKV